jgi:hypothetical protein
MNLSYRVFVSCIIAAGAAVAALSAQSPNLAIANRSNAFASIAASGSFVVVAWGAAPHDGASDVYVAASTDAGRTFGIPVRVSAGGGRPNLSGEQPPRIAFIPRLRSTPSIVVTWTARITEGTRLLSARSDDGGKTFAAAAVVPGTDAPGNRGWETTATTSAGEVIAVWLDHRRVTDSGRSAGHAGHQHGGTAAQQRDGVARAQLSQLFFAQFGRPNSVKALTGGVCYCCKTAVATGPNDQVYAAWRHVYPGNIRDIAFAASTDGGRTFSAPVRVSEDGWVLDGCPENGPAMAVDDRGRIHIVWPTLLPARQKGGDPQMALFHASSENGRTFTARQPLPTEGFPGHAQLAVTADGEPVAVWDELAEGARRVAGATGVRNSQGGMRFVRQRFDAGAGGMYPAVATANDRTVVAWTSGAGPNTAVRVAALPR